MIGYKFNNYRFSGEQATKWTENARGLMTSGRGFWTGQQMAEILYRHKVEGLTMREIYRFYPYVPAQTLRTILSGKYSAATTYYFETMQQDEPELLKALLTTTITKGRG